MKTYIMKTHTSGVGLAVGLAVVGLVVGELVGSTPISSGIGSILVSRFSVRWGNSDPIGFTTTTPLASTFIVLISP